MLRNEAIEAIEAYFEENEEEFNTCIEELDGYNGFLGDDRYFDMEMIDEFYAGVNPSEFLNRVYYGHDDDNWSVDASGNKSYGEFNPNREYFYYNGYGNLVSSDYKDYSAHLDHWFVEDLIQYAESLYDIPDEVQEIIDSIEESEETIYTVNIKDLEIMPEVQTETVETIA